MPDALLSADDSLPPARQGIVTWLHLGDLHIVGPKEQNAQDLTALVDEINHNFAGKNVDFVFLPGDLAEHGSMDAFQIVQDAVAQLQLPCQAIVGDHDVHEEDFRNFQRFIRPDLHGAFSVGDVRFFRLNAFSDPRPDSFHVSTEQLDWLESELKAHGQKPSVILMHCYPSDLRQGGERLSQLLHSYPVRLVDMGHTHYNEISNDGQVLYTTTRSTGQIEEGPVGYSLLSLDGDVVSWHFLQLGKDLFVSITSPSDERLLRDGSSGLSTTAPTQVRASVWGKDPIHAVEVLLAGKSPVPMTLHNGSWTCDLPAHTFPAGVHELRVRALDVAGHAATDQIQVLVGDRAARVPRFSIDQENALPAWPSRHILGTQLGPNKNGHPW